MEHLNLPKYGMDSASFGAYEVNDAYRRLSLGESFVSKRIYNKPLRRGAYENKK